MVNIKKILFSLIAMLLCSCAVSRVSSGLNNSPTKSFVKIIHMTTVSECHKNTKGRCQLGTFAQTGSGMAISLFKNHMTVLTAGHVCDSQPDGGIIKDSFQIIYVIDHNNNRHQAWPVHVSFNDQVSKGDLCLLWAPTLNVEKIKVSFFSPKIGDELYYIGSPLGIYHPPTVPIFKGIYSGKISGSAAMVTFPAIGGSSGAAVLDKNNRIVGVVFAANVQFHHVTIITTHESLKLFLIKAKKKLSSTQ